MLDSTNIVCGGKLKFAFWLYTFYLADFLANDMNSLSFKVLSTTESKISPTVTILKMKIGKVSETSTKSRYFLGLRKLSYTYLIVYYLNYILTLFWHSSYYVHSGWWHCSIACLQYIMFVMVASAEVPDADLCHLA